MNLLCAVSYFLCDRKEEPFQLLDELLPIVKERRFDRLIADERSNQEIADFMGISINTVKFHGKIYLRSSGSGREDRQYG